MSTKKKSYASICLDSEAVPNQGLSVAMKFSPELWSKLSHHEITRFVGHLQECISIVGKNIDMLAQYELTKELGEEINRAFEQGGGVTFSIVRKTRKGGK